MKNCIYLSKHQIFLFPCLLTNLMALNNKQGRTYCSSFPINLRKLLTIISMNSTEDLSRVIYFILVFFLENNYIRKCNIFKKLCEWCFFYLFSVRLHIAHLLEIQVRQFVGFRKRCYSGVNVTFKNWSSRQWLVVGFHSVTLRVIFDKLVYPPLHTHTHHHYQNYFKSYTSLKFWL